MCLQDPVRLFLNIRLGELHIPDEIYMVILPLPEVSVTPLLAVVWLSLQYITKVNDNDIKSGSSSQHGNFKFHLLVYELDTRNSARPLVIW